MRYAGDFFKSPPSPPKLPNKEEWLTIGMRFYQTLSLSQINFSPYQKFLKGVENFFQKVFHVTPPTMKKVFIDGSAGTTGLRIKDRLSGRADIELITLSEEERKLDSARSAAINAADIVFLCLPDDAARQAVAMCEDPHTVILDTSTAHRTDPRFAYGFPELSAEHKEKIIKSKRIAVPGCHASGFIALIYPLIKAGIIDSGEHLTCMSLTGYSGGGKKMIADYEAEGRDPLLGAPRQYGLTQSHKHLPEMCAVTGLESAPVFMPVVGDFYSGMEVSVPLHASQVKGGTKAVKAAYANAYTEGLVHFDGEDAEGGFLSAGAYSGKDDMHITVHGNNERIILTARYDNLGKGASGAAVECMNLVLGVDYTTGLDV